MAFDKRKGGPIWWGKARPQDVPTLKPEANPEGLFNNVRSAQISDETLFDDVKREFAHLYRKGSQHYINVTQLSGHTYEEVLEAAGNVFGPSDGISTNNALALWDGTDGRLLKNSTVTWDGTTLTAYPGLIVASRIALQDGSESSPSFTFFTSGHSQTGLFYGDDYLGNEGLAIAIAGTQRFHFSDDAIEVPAGDVSTPSIIFTGGSRAGIYLDLDSANGPAMLDVDGVPQLLVDTAGVIIPNKLTVGGLIDPTGLVLTDQGSLPGGAPAAGAHTIWVGNSGDLLYFNSPTVQFYIPKVATTFSAIDNEIPRFHTDVSQLQGTGIVLADPSGSVYRMHTKHNAFGDTTDFWLATGDSSGTSGDIRVDTGSGGTAGGAILIGDSLANSVAIGRATKTTTINGTLVLATDLAVADGGTGAGTAAGAATNLGLGTGDSPQFTGINVGHATDTTITRTGAGDIAVEGNLIYRAGGTDVPLTDGGTGASTAAAARTNLEVDKAVVAGQLAPQDIAINSTSVVTLLSKTITGAVAGDVIDFEAQLLVLNNSGAARTHTVQISLGAFTVICIDGATLVNHASNRSVFTIKGSIAIVSTSLARGCLEFNRSTPAAAGTAGSGVLAQNRFVWNTTTSDLTGNPGATISMMGGNATATQTATCICINISKRQAV